MRLMNTIVIIGMITVLQSLGYGQKEAEEVKLGWDKKMVGSLNFTQASFDNWSAGSWRPDAETPPIRRGFAST